MLEEPGSEHLSEEVKTGVSTRHFRCDEGLNGLWTCCESFPFILQTTIIAVEFDVGVVLGSDSRVSAG